MADPVGYTQENLRLRVDTPLGDDAFRVREIRGEEALSSLFRYEVELLSEDGEIDFAAMVGQQISVSILFADGSTKRHVTGIVTDFSQHDHDRRFWLYRAVVRPPFWLATRAAGCRIFQEQSVTDIAETVLGELGIADVSLETAGTYAAREYCVQYNETAHDFLMRLFEAEGVFTFHRHDADSCTLVVADDADAHPDCAGLSEARYRPMAQESTEEEDAITRLRFTRRVVSDAFASDDFNFETPATDLYAEAAGEGSGSGMEVYEYPGGYSVKDSGEALTDLRMQALEMPMAELAGTSHCKAFVAGHGFTLAGHDRADVNGAYVLRRVSLRATQESYENRFKAFPKDVPYRRARVTPRPRIRGAQTAIVAGPSGEEIWTDKFGRIKCKFHWDQLGPGDDGASCWIRVAQSWAGKQWGGFVLPRVGMEVVVAFLDGDPDRPLVTGAVYNGEALPPYALPGEQTKTTMKSNSSKGGGGFNEWRFEDKAGEEEVYLHAQKDWNSVIENDRTTTLVEGNDTLTVQKGNRVFAVETGTETHSVAGSRTLKVDDGQSHQTNNGFVHEVVGDFTLKVDGAILIEATGGVTVKAGGDMALEAGGNHDSKAGMSMSHTAAMDLAQSADMNVETKAGMNLTAEGGMNTDIKAGMNLTAEGSMNATVKGGMNLTAEGGMNATAKGGLNGNFEGGVMAALKGAITKLG